MAACTSGPDLEGVGEHAVGLAHGAEGAALGLEEGHDDTFVTDVVLGDDTVAENHGDGSELVGVLGEEEDGEAESTVEVVAGSVDGVTHAGGGTGGAPVDIAAESHIGAAVAETIVPLALDTDGVHDVSGNGVDSGKSHSLDRFAENLPNKVQKL